MECILWISNQYHCIFNAIKVSFIPIDIIFPAVSGHKADSE